MELEGIISGEGYEEATGKVLWKGTAVVVQEQRVVAQWRHSNTYLGQVVQVLQCWHLGTAQYMDHTSLTQCSE